MRVVSSSADYKIAGRPYLALLVGTMSYSAMCIGLSAQCCSASVPLCTV